MNTEYELYKTKVNYTSGWALTRIDSPSGAYITFTYAIGSETSERPVNVGIYVVKEEMTLGSTDLKNRALYTVNEMNSSCYITHINTSSAQQIDFGYALEDGLTSLSSVKINDLRRGSGTASFVKQYDFEYRIVPYIYISGGDAYSRPFLEKISEYNGVRYNASLHFSYNNVSDGVRLTAPMASVDAWGYYNGTGNDQLIPKICIYPAETGADLLQT